MPKARTIAFLLAVAASLPAHINRALAETQPCRFATNAGMFDPALKPVGLYVEQGQERVHVNTRSEWQLLHEAERDFLLIRRRGCRRGAGGVSQAADQGRPGDAVWADACD